MGISFRRAARTDCPGLVGLIGELGYPSSLASVQQRLGAILEREEHALFVAQDGNRLAGWVHVQEFHSLASERCALISGLVVHEHARRSGIGRGLVECAEGWARERGLRSLRLRARESRTGAHAFYGRLGFQPSKTQVQFRKEL